MVIKKLLFIILLIRSQSILEQFTAYLNSYTNDTIKYLFNLVQIKIMTTLVDDNKLFGDYHQNCTERPLKNEKCFKLFNSNDRFSKRFAELKTDTADEEEYTILIDNLKEIENYSDLEFNCLFALAYSPPKVISGNAYSRFYSFFGRNIFADFINYSWQGEFFFDMKCNNNFNMNLVVNSVFEKPSFYALAYISDDPINSTMYISNSEKWDERDCLWIDYFTKLDYICESELAENYDTAAKTITLNEILDRKDIFIPEKTKNYLNSKILNTSFPRTLLNGPLSLNIPVLSMKIFLTHSFPFYLLSAVRWIGRDKENKVDFYLGRMMVMFADGFRTVGWFNIKTTDLIVI